MPTWRWCPPFTAASHGPWCNAWQTMARTEPPRTGRLARGTITGIAAARIGMAQVGLRVRTPSAQAQADYEAALGGILFGALGQLRGSALKVSQLLSMHPGLLPDGVRQELARARHHRGGQRDDRDRGHAAARGGLPAGGRTTAVVRRARGAARRGAAPAHPVAHPGSGAHTAVSAGPAPAGVAGHRAHAGTTRPGRAAPVGLVHALPLCAGPSARRSAPGQFLVRTRWHRGRAGLWLHAQPVRALSNPGDKSMVRTAAPSYRPTARRAGAAGLPGTRTRQRQPHRAGLHRRTRARTG